MPADSDHALAHATAAAAGERLLAMRGHVGGAEADAASHALIVELLSGASPDDAIRSEEGNRGDTSRAGRVWIVDPLDGTREYCETGRADWAVHVALWDRDRLVAGAVALPALGSVVSTYRPLPPTTAAHRRPRILVSRTRPAAVASAVAAALGADVVELGSAGAKALAVARGEADVYVHDGGQYEWDSAAPAAVASACGLHVSRLDGTPLTYNNADPWLPDLLVCRSDLAEAVLKETAPAEQS